MDKKDQGAMGSGTFAPTDTIQDPLDTLSQLGALIKATGKTSEQLIEERIDEKHAL